MKQLPSRRQKGLKLSYDSGDLFVSFFGYSASLSCAYNEEVLHHNYREELELKPHQMKIINEWMDHFDDYFEQNGWKTWSEVNE